MATYQISGSVFDELTHRYECDEDSFSTVCRQAVDHIIQTAAITRCGRGSRVKFDCSPEQYAAVCREILERVLRQFISESDVCPDFRRDAAGVIKALRVALSKAGV